MNATPALPTPEEAARIMKIVQAFDAMYNEMYDRAKVQQAIDNAEADTVDAAELARLIAHTRARLQYIKPQV